MLRYCGNTIATGIVTKVSWTYNCLLEDIICTTYVMFRGYLIGHAHYSMEILLVKNI